MNRAYLHFYTHEIEQRIFTFYTGEVEQSIFTLNTYEIEQKIFTFYTREIELSILYKQYYFIQMFYMWDCFIELLTVLNLQSAV